MSKLILLLTLLMLSLTGPVWGNTTAYQYDSLGRLSKVTMVINSTTTTITYTYDALGNRTTVTTVSD